MANRSYLGDGVYIAPGRFRGEYIICTSNGITDQHHIYLDTYVWRALKAYLDKIVEEEDKE